MRIDVWIEVTYIDGAFVSYSMSICLAVIVRLRLQCSFAFCLIARDDEDEFSDASRPLSPVEGPTQVIPAQSFQQLFASNMDLDAASRSTQATAYMSATSCSSSRPGFEPNQCAAGESVDPSGLRHSFIPFGFASMNELLSLATKHADPNSTPANGFQLGLEEVPPLAPGAPPMDSAYLQQSDSTNQPEFGTYEPVVNPRVDNTSHPSYDINSGVVSQLSHASSVSQGRVCPSQPYCTSTPDSDSVINLTCTIPASLEALLRDITCRLCSSPSRPYILLPSADTSHDGTTLMNSMRILEVPSGHIFLGVPEIKASNQPCGSYSLTTFRAPVDPSFIVLNGFSPDGRAAGPHVYKTPPDCAVVLSPNGVVHRLDKAALVVPVAPSDAPRTSTPPLSPGLDNGLVHLPNASVQVRELPIQTNVDTLTFDDVLNLLLALRSTSQPSIPHRSNTTSPTVDTHTTAHPLAQSTTDNQPVTTNASRRSSALPGLHGVNTIHSMHNLLPAQLLQPQLHTVTGFSQQHPSGIPLRSTPQFQSSQPTPLTGTTFLPDAHFQPSQLGGVHIPYSLQAQLSTPSELPVNVMSSAFAGHAQGVPRDVQPGAAYGNYNTMHSTSLQSQPTAHPLLKNVVDRLPGGPLPASNLQQALFQQLLQRTDQPPQQSAACVPPQSQIDSLYAAGQNAQSVMQLLAALNANTPDQVCCFRIDLII